MTRRLLIALLLLDALPARAQDDAKALSSFADLRAEVLDAIGGASRRVWLVTDYLTDGEIVSALYLAQYRKLDVQVLLGRGKANFYMSRLNYLKNQNIPVFLRPDSFKPGQPTALLSDDRLLLVDGELDFLTKVRQFHVTTASPERRDAFHAAFASAAGLRMPAVPHQVPLVGKSAGKGRVYSPVGVSSSGAAGNIPPKPLPASAFRQSPGAAGPDANGAYTYGRAQTPRPEGVPAKLPRAVKWGEQQAKPKPAVPQGPTAEPAKATESEVHVPGAPALPEEGG